MWSSLRFVLRSAFIPRFSSTVLYCKLAVQPKLTTMKFDSPLFKAIFTPETNLLSDMFKKYGYELRIAGGAVRDLLLNKQPTDVDFATTATPDEMRKMFTEEGIRMFNRKGEGHGTVTVRVNDRQNFEITTLRVDIHTDGRHAEVEFTKNWELDAGRRDLTINAMFLGLDGTLYDYFRGVEDLEKRFVKFVGDPESRIKEDYLRILRYFRFYGKIALKPDEHDSMTLEAIRNNVGGLEKISGERIWVELKKMLAGNHIKHIILRMLDLGIAPFIGLPLKPNSEEFKDVCDRSVTLNPEPVTLLTALLNSEEEAMNIHSRLKFSKYDRDLALFIIQHREEKPCEDPLRPYKALILETKMKVSDTQEYVHEVLKYKGDIPLLEGLRQWKVPKFPLSGSILLKKGVKSGPNVSIIMSQLKTKWIESNCSLSEEELLNELDKLIKNM